MGWPLGNKSRLSLAGPATVANPMGSCISRKLKARSFDVIGGHVCEGPELNPAGRKKITDTLGSLEESPATRDLLIHTEVKGSAISLVAKAGLDLPANVNMFSPRPVFRVMFAFISG